MGRSIGQPFGPHKGMEMGWFVMEMTARRRSKGPRQRGLTIIELLIAMIVLAVGLGGVLVLFIAAIGGGSRSRLDTQAVQISQTALETLAAAPATATTVPIKDCAGNVRNLTTSANTTPLNAKGDIDWTRAAVSSVEYVSCGANGRQATYQVRWNISQTAYTSVKLINVSARLKNQPNSPRVFSIPVTLHTMAGQ